MTGRLRSTALLLFGAVLALLAALAAAPAFANEVDVRERVEYYAVRGRTAEALLSEMSAKGPPAPFEPGRRYFASAEHMFGWTYEYAPGASGCAITEFDVSVDIAYTYPRWDNRAEGSGKLNAYWDRFLGRLEVHELGHGDIARETGVNIARALQALAPQATCKELVSAINETAKSVTKAGDMKQRAYDRETGHGKTQGAWFDVGEARRYRAPREAASK